MTTNKTIEGAGKAIWGNYFRIDVNNNQKLGPFDFLKLPERTTAHNIKPAFPPMFEGNTIIYTFDRVLVDNAAEGYIAEPGANTSLDLSSIYCLLSGDVSNNRVESIDSITRSV